MKSKRSISVITPVHNASKWIDTAHDSLLGQTCQKFEWILVDDGSTDGSREALASLAASSALSIKVIHHDRCRGAAAARNTGVASAQGDYLKFLDADDVLEPNHLRSQLHTALGYPGQVVASPTKLVIPSAECPIEFVDKLFYTLDFEGDMLARFLQLPGFSHCGCLIPRELFALVGGYDESLVTDEDGWLVFSLMMRGVGFVPDPNTYYTYNIWRGGEGASASVNVGLEQIESRYEVCGRLIRYACTVPDRAQLRDALAGRLGGIALECGRFDLTRSARYFDEAEALAPGYVPARNAHFVRLQRAFGTQLAVAAYLAYNRIRSVGIDVKYKLHRALRSRRTTTEAPRARAHNERSRPLPAELHPPSDMHDHA